MEQPRNNTSDMLLIFLGMCLFVYLLLCFVSCSTPRGALASQKDSVRTVITERVVYRDTVIHVPVPVESDNAVLLDTDTSFLRTSLAESEAFVRGGKLHHSIRNRSEQLQPINLKLPEKILQTDNFLMKQQTVTVEVERELTRWQKLLHALGLGTFVALCAALLYMAIRIVRKFI